MIKQILKHAGMGITEDQKRDNLVKIYKHEGVKSDKNSGIIVLLKQANNFIRRDQPLLRDMQVYIESIGKKMVIIDPKKEKVVEFDK